jgi:hypothetical protein
MKSFWKFFGVVMLGIVILCSLISFVAFGAAGLTGVLNGLYAINTELASGFVLCLLALGCYWIIDLCGDILIAIKTKME